MEQPKPKTTGCKVCGNEPDDMRRGLCQKHYRRYMAKLKTLEPAEAEAFEAKCIADGWLEESRQGQKSTKDFDPFDDLVAEVQAEFEEQLGPKAEAAKQAKAPAKTPRKRKAN
ncbi:hypothetical protein [Allorhodopirellula heiligendammensis]|uniref:Uncharacterized protein n=1 Tax=Allorhodopirellula heiligendammensis TaxID=2714739 RepID=A0A5C6C206_9BACT|nr:hypothetical protein [Allorhodopirellula heiligendammensis]TWU18027.1 hypothetical protein Poly21_01800 [Allorhodopirellula heiligendammensis]